MNPNRYSIALLLMIVTAAALVAWVFQSAVGNRERLATILAAISLFLIINFAFYAIVFIPLYLLGRADQVMQARLQQPQSPFATDRLPPQIVPVQDNEKAQ